MMRQGRSSNCMPPHVWGQLAAIVIMALAATPAAAHPHIKRWAFEGAIITIADESGIFDGLAIGDRVHGTLSFDVTVSVAEEVDWGDGELQTIYDQPEAFPLTTLVTESVASGVVTEYVPYLSGFMEAGDNITHWSNPGSVEDMLLFEQDFYAPDTTDWTGYTSQVQFLASPAAFSTATLPPELVLDVWQSVTVTLAKYGEPLFFDGAVTAQIHALTPVDVPLLLGDFTGDGVVDARDLDAWQYVYGSIDANLAADATLDNVVDGADFLVWQRQLGETAPVAAVPEPTSLVLAALAAICASLVGRRRMP